MALSVFRTNLWLFVNFASRNGLFYAFCDRPLTSSASKRSSCLESIAADRTRPRRRPGRGAQAPAAGRGQRLQPGPRRAAAHVEDRRIVSARPLASKGSGRSCRRRGFGASDASRCSTRRTSFQPSRIADGFTPDDVASREPRAAEPRAASFSTATSASRSTPSSTTSTISCVRRAPSSTSPSAPSWPTCAAASRC